MIGRKVSDSRCDVVLPSLFLVASTRHKYMESPHIVIAVEGNQVFCEAIHVMQFHCGSLKNDKTSFKSIDFLLGSLLVYSLV